MSSAVYLFMNKYTDITPALYSEEKAESSLLGAWPCSQLGLHRTEPREPLEWAAKWTSGQEQGPRTSRREHTREGKRATPSGDEGP